MEVSEAPFIDLTNSKICLEMFRNSYKESPVIKTAKLAEVPVATSVVLSKIGWVIKKAAPGR